MFLIILIIWGSILTVVTIVSFSAIGDFEVLDLLVLIIPLFLLFVVLRFLHLFCWHLWGREEVTITPKQFILNRKVFGLTKSKSFMTSKIKNVQFAPMYQGQQIMRSEWTFWHLSGGPIVFDYENDKCSFGQGINESEAETLLAQLRERAYFHA